MSKFIPPPPPTLEEIVEGHGGMNAYLNDPEIMAKNNGLNAHDIRLLLKESYAAVHRQTGRDVRTIKTWETLIKKEEDDGAGN